MTKLARLKKEAKEIAEWRGHELKTFRTNEFYETEATSECQNCGAWVTVNSNPMPNQIDIGGPAAALNCSVADMKLYVGDM